MFNNANYGDVPILISLTLSLSELNSLYFSGMGVPNSFGILKSQGINTYNVSFNSNNGDKVNSLRLPLTTSTPVILYEEY